VPFWVSIRVIAPPPANSAYSYDFVANICAASWRTQAGPLACPGVAESEDGLITFLQRPELENGRTEDEPALWVRPFESSNGWISGAYPVYRVKAGDHFMSEVGCLDNSNGCAVDFALYYTIGNGPLTTIGVWKEAYDGKTTIIDVDLTSLAGNDVRFYLGVENRGRASAADAFWLVPSIRQRPVVDPGYDKIPAAAAARDRLAQALGLAAKDVVIKSVEQRTWSDSCLGVVQQNVACADVIVPGYRVILQANGRLFEAHTNSDGTQVVWFEN
jgi:hypothetical protein